MSAKTLLAVIAVSSIISAAVGFGLSQVSQPETANAARGGGNAVVKELRKLNKEMRKTSAGIDSVKAAVEEVDDTLGYGTTDINSVLYFLDRTAAATFQTCRQLGGTYTGCRLP